MAVLVLAAALAGGCTRTGTRVGPVPGGGTTPGRSPATDYTAYDEDVKSGVQDIVVGCMAFAQDTGLKPSAMTVMTSIAPYMESWPRNPYTGEPMTNTESGVGNFEVYSFPGNAGPSGSKVDGVRGLLSTGQWYDVEVPY